MAEMILNSDVTVTQQLGTPTTNQAYVKVYNLVQKINNMKPTTLALIIGACVVFIIERKIRYKPKTLKFNIKGGKQ